MRNIFLWASTLGVVISLGVPLAGCDGGDGTGGSGGSGASGGQGGAGGGGPSVETACARLAAALCGQIDTCSPFLMSVTYGDRATCESRVAARCDDPPALDSANIGGTEIDACAVIYEGRTCDQLFDPAPSECRVPGDKDDGATCATAAECKSNVCDASGEGSCGTCATPLAEGAACGSNTVQCDFGLYCNDNTGKCDKPAGNGEACTVEKFCAAGLSCNSGICGAPLGEGADCANGEVCDFANGLICLVLSSTCAKLGVSKLGEACGLNMDTGEVTTCEADARCDSATDTCIARPKEGESCTIDPDTGNSDCASGFDCIGGQCQAGLPTCQ